MADALAPAPASERVGTDHLVPCGTGEWAWWRQVVLRGAGFPADGVLELADSQLAALADAAGDDLASFRPAYQRALLAIDERLRRIARSPELQEAVTWQNHRVLDTAVAPLLRRGPERGRDRKHRGHEDLLASYWQRYCVKNDSIGFFGPVGWARLAPDPASVRLRVGPRLVAASDVYFESWAIDAVAEAVSADDAVRPWLPIRRAPYVRLERDSARLPGRPPLTLDAAELAALQRCDGIARACDVAGALRGSNGLLDDASVYAVLDSLVARRLAVWKLEVPVDPRPERALRETLERIEDRAQRARALAALDELERARDRVAASRGDPARLQVALNELDEVFQRIAGTAPSRHPGRMYAARTLVYHDCRRDADVVLGESFLRTLDPLVLLLESARWLTFETARELRVALLEIDDRLRAERPAGLDLATLWFEAMPVLHGRLDDIASGLGEEYRRRWAEILRCPLDAHVVRYAAAELADPVRAAFASPGAGWDGARYHSPDVMVAARDLEAFAEGDFEVVVGEFHVAINAIRHACFVAQHPDPDELLRAVDGDSPEPRLLAVMPKDSPPKLTTRLHSGLVRESDIQVALFHYTADPRRGRVVNSADLLVVRDGDHLCAELEDGKRYDVLDVFAEVLTGAVLDRLRLFAEELPHSPRVYFDRVVVSRETWRFQAGEPDFAAIADEAARFVAARRWRSAFGLPRHVFVSATVEAKPVYIDFDSPLYVNVLAKLVRKLRRERGGDARLTLVEMLPTIEHTWLVDAEGRRFTSELRLAAVDLLGARAP
jgi:hypothetical protein